MSSFDCDDGRGQDRLAQCLAQQLDCEENGRGVARYLQELYCHDRQGFTSLVLDINRREQNGRGDDLTITQNGEVFVSDCNRQIHVGRIQQDHGRYGRRDYDDCDPRERGHDWDRGRGRRDYDDCDPRERGTWGRSYPGNRDYDPRYGPYQGRGRSGVDINIDIDVNSGRYPDGYIPIPDCYGNHGRQPIYRPDRDCDPRYQQRGPIIERDCDPSGDYRPEVYRGPYVDRECRPPRIIRRDRDCDPDYRVSRRGGEYNQDGEVAGTIIGGVLGGVIGHNSGGRRDNTLLGVFAGGALGNVIGREVDRDRNQRYYNWR